MMFWKRDQTNQTTKASFLEISPRNPKSVYDFFEAVDGEVPLSFGVAEEFTVEFLELEHGLVVVVELKKGHAKEVKQEMKIERNEV